MNSNKTFFESGSNFKWRPVIGLILVYMATFMQWYWIWGVLFLVWVLPDIFSKTTYFMEPVSANKNPFLFWIIVVTWLGLSLWYLSDLFIDYSSYYVY